ncbi:hypothetical protein CCACVL1_11054 [Corchorus capsularis]|uniref:Uncharacterized protein n=1 Tax=Corchorus capsularis TaxID=210143 RepID=A0A1R3IN36_COCAP|nr:hypothetical protein CCACVL1_11054 [Corchorus capsularis]
MDGNNNSNLPIDQPSRNRMNRLSVIREHRQRGRFHFVRPRGSHGRRILDRTSNLHLLSSQNRLDISDSVMGVDVDNGSEIYAERTHLDEDSPRNLVSRDNHANYIAFIQRRDVINSRTVVGVNGNVISTTTSTVGYDLVTSSMESNLLPIYQSAEVGSSSATIEGVSLPGSEDSLPTEFNGEFNVIPEVESVSRFQTENSSGEFNVITEGVNVSGSQVENSSDSIVSDQLDIKSECGDVLEQGEPSAFDNGQYISIHH